MNYHGKPGAYGVESDGFDYWLCSDCTVWAANGDASGIEGEDRVRAVQDGVASLTAEGGHLACNDDPETGEGREDFSWSPCDACGSSGGERTRFAVLVPRKPRVRYLRGTGSDPFQDFGVQHEPGWEYVVSAESPEHALVRLDAMLEAGEEIPTRVRGAPLRIGSRVREVLWDAARLDRLTVRLSMLDDYPHGDVCLATVAGPMAHHWADADGTIGGSSWETPRDMRARWRSEAYAMPGNHAGLVEELRAAGYSLDLSEYSEPDYSEPCDEADCYCHVVAEGTGG